MKKAVIVILTVILMIILCACGKSEAPTEEGSTAASAGTTVVGSTDSASETSTAAAGTDGESTAAAATTAAATTTAAAADQSGTTEATASLEAFMGTWHYSDAEMNATWQMAQKGDGVQVTLSGTFADGETMSQSADCTYELKDGVLTLYSDEYEGGSLTLQFTGKDELTATVNSEEAAPIIMKR